MVVGGVPLNAADAAIKARLEQSFGMLVDVKLGPDVQAGHANGKRLVLISESTLSTTVGSRLNSVAIPMVVLEPALWDGELKMTGTVWMTDHGDAQNQTQLNIVNAAHPLAAGLPAGLVTVATPGNKFVWGRPNANAIKTAKLVGLTPDAWGVFAYETGAGMFGINAPARRVGLYPGRDTAANFTAAGWKLFEAAVLWAAGAFELAHEPATLPELVLAAGA
jgi:hypothetical protein